MERVAVDCVRENLIGGDEGVVWGEGIKDSGVEEGKGVIEKGEGLDVGHLVLGKGGNEVGGEVLETREEM